MPEPQRHTHPTTRKDPSCSCALGREVDKARAKLAEAVKEHGKRSEQARDAQEELIQLEHEHGDLVRAQNAADQRALDEESARRNPRSLR